MIDTRSNTGKAAFTGALAAVMVGVCVLAGWLFDLEFLKRIAPGFVAMNPATAVGFILAGASLALFLRSPHGRDQKSRALILTARLCALVVTLIGLAKLVSILGGWDLGVDRWLFASKLPDGLRFLNRIAPNTALSFLLLGSALLFVNVKNRSVRFCVEFSAVIVGFGSFLAVLAYAYDIQSFYGLSAFIPMALHTAITFSVLIVAFLLSHTDSGLLAVFAGGTAGGTMARRLLPAAVLVPAMLGWLTRQGEEAGIYHGGFGEAAFAVGNILVFTFLVCWSAKGLSSADLVRKKAEEALRESQQLIEGIMNAIPVRVFWKDKNLVYLGCNAAFARDAGFADPKDIIGKDDYQMGWGDRAELYRADDRQVIESGCAKLLIEEPLTSHGGNTVTILTSKIPLRNSTGEINGVLGTYLDITDRKQAELASIRLAAIIESSGDAIIGKDLNGIITSWNKGAEKLFGYTASEMMGTSIMRLIPADRLDEESHIQKKLRRGETVESFETLRQTKDGRLIDVSVTASPIKDATGKIIGVSKVARDITTSRQTEAALRSSEERFRIAAETANDVIYEWDLKQSVEWVGKIDDLLGYEPGEFPRTLNGFAASVHPEDLERAMAAIQAHLEGRGPYAIEYRVRRKDGVYRWWSARGAAARTPDGKLTRWIGSITDVTERKRAEEALRKSADRLRLATESALVGIWELDLEKNVLIWDKRMYELYGISAEDFGGAYEAWEKGVHPDDLVAARAELQDAIAGKKDFHTQFRVVWPDGQIHFVEAHAVVQRAPNGTPKRAIGVNWDITERKQAEVSLRQLQKLNKAILDSAAYGIHGIDTAGRFVFENPAAARMLGWEAADLIGKSAHVTMHHTRADGTAYPAEQCPIYAALRHGRLNQVSDEVFWRKDGSSFPVEYTVAPLRGERGEITGVVVVFADITERKRLEAQLSQSQKLETVGKLAGGIAHEFNSIMTAIIGQSELLLGDLPAGSPLVKNATEISKAAERAAILTRQLLAYGRKQILQPEILDLNSVLAGMESTLRHLMGRGADVRIVPAGGLKAVKADAGQIEQVIMNMAMNAADAMPNGGKLTLETANVTLDQEYVSHFPELKAGEYVMLAITDTGTGMSKEAKARVFEPFFSTKGVGQGTGLGLSTCYGIVKQSGGHISVYSERARGATFKIYLPQVEPQTKIPIQRLDQPDLPRGTETILLVEDDPALREMAATLLRRLGYTVLAAANGIEALSLKQQRDTGHIDLLFTDVVMPHMSGKELADRVRALYPHTRILFTSAYTENAIVHQGVLDEGVALLQKPFTPSALALKVRKVLDEPSAPKPDTAQETFGFTPPGGANTP